MMLSEAYTAACNRRGVAPLPPMSAFAQSVDARAQSDAGAHTGHDDGLELVLRGNTVPIQVLKRRLVDSDVASIGDALCEAASVGIPSAHVASHAHADLLRSLRHIALPYNDLTDASCSVLAFLIANLGVAVLDIGHNEITGAGVEALTHAHTQRPAGEDAGGDAESALHTLILDGNPIGDRGALALAGALASASAGVGRVRVLTLAHTHIRTSGVIALMDAVKTSRSLVHLDMSEPELFSRNDEVVLHTCDALRVNRSLVSLRVCAWATADAGVEHLCEGILDNDGVLEDLDLSKTRISGPSGVALARCLVAGASLVRLRLCAAALGDEGAMALAAALNHASAVVTLRELDIRSNGVRDAGLVALSTVLHPRLMPGRAHTHTHAHGHDAGQGQDAEDASAAPDALACPLDVLLVSGNFFAPGAPGTVAFCRALLDTGTRTLTDVTPYTVDGVLHLAHQH